MRTGEYQVMFREEENHWFYTSLRRLLFSALDEALPDWPNRAILDAGCGTGLILQRLGAPERNRGVDLSPDAIELCHQRGLENVQVADIAQLPFADATFDAVICSSVLYHEWVKDVDGALRELRRVLRPDGWLLLNLPAYPFLHSPHDEAVMTARRFTRRQVLRLLETNGFAITRLTYWISFLFPLALLARTFGGSKAGRDFSSDGLVNRLTNRTFGAIESAELGLLRLTGRLPFGVALFAVARRSATGPGGS